MTEKLFEMEIRGAITGSRGATVMPQIEYRQMVALEQIAESLARLEELIKPSLMLAAPSVSVTAGGIGHTEVSDVEAIGPALEHRRRRRQGIE